MNKFMRLVLLFGVCISLSCGCSKPEKPMPITKNNIANYMQQMATAMKSTDPKEREAARGDEKMQKDLFYKSYVEPLEKMGYSYDKTISDLANNFLAKTIRTSDAAMTVMLSDLLTFAKDTRGAAHKYGFISTETKVLLDQVSLILPRTIIPAADATPVPATRDN